MSAEKRGKVISIDRGRERLERIVTIKPEFCEVPLNKIIVKPQMRKSIDDELIDVLAENIRIVGLINPAVVTGNLNQGCTMVAGHRRRRAFLKLNEWFPGEYEKMPAWVFSKLSTEQFNALQCAENSYVHNRRFFY